MFHTRFDSVEREHVVQDAQEFLSKPSGLVGLDYLLKERQLSPGIVKRFSLGFLPFDYDHQLAGRIILPIYDASGHLIAISSREIIKGKSDLPTYWHENFEKSFYLYGLHLAKETIRKWKHVICCEGQIDAIQLHAHGMTNAVALCGTNFHKMQLAMIYRYCSEIVLLLDKDENLSGEKGVEKILKTLNNVESSECPTYNIKVGVARFDNNIEGKMDADSFIRKFGITSLKDIIKRTVKKMRDVT